jgi:hypothetical protein
MKKKKKTHTRRPLAVIGKPTGKRSKYSIKIDIREENYKGINGNVGFQVLTAVVIKNYIFWDKIPS